MPNASPGAASVTAARSGRVTARHDVQTLNLIAYRVTIDPAQTNLIDFVDRSWRTFVPIAVPWDSVRSGTCSPGSVAVLINRAHSFY